MTYNIVDGLGMYTLPWNFWPLGTQDLSSPARDQQLAKVALAWQSMRKLFRKAPPLPSLSWMSTPHVDSWWSLMSWTLLESACWETWEPWGPTNRPLDLALNSCSVSSLVSAHIHCLHLALSLRVTHVLLLLGLPCSPMAKTDFISPFLSPALPPSLPLHTRTHKHTWTHHTYTVYLCTCTHVYTCRYMHTHTHTHKYTHTHQCFQCSLSISWNGLPFELFVCLNCCLPVLPSGSPLFQNSFVSNISKKSTG